MANQEQRLTSKILSSLYYTDGKTLQEIGDLYSISRERVRQLMERWSLPRVKTRKRHTTHPKYKNLEEYFNSVVDGKKERTGLLLKFIEKTRCSECGFGKTLHIHHIRYPATSINDIQILCSSCHMIKHKKGMTYKKQLLLYELHIKGVTYKELAEQFNISFALVGVIIHKIKNGYHTLRH